MEQVVKGSFSSLVRRQPSFGSPTGTSDISIACGIVTGIRNNTHVSAMVACSRYQNVNTLHFGERRVLIVLRRGGMLCGGVLTFGTYYGAPVPRGACKVLADLPRVSTIFWPSQKEGRVDGKSRYSQKGRNMYSKIFGWVMDGLLGVRNY